MFKHEVDTRLLPILSDANRGMIEDWAIECRERMNEDPNQAQRFNYFMVLDDSATTLFVVVSMGLIRNRNGTLGFRVGFGHQTHVGRIFDSV